VKIKHRRLRNKGSTDQHAYVQQLRDGVLNFFLTFIEVAKGSNRAAFEVEDGVTAVIICSGFLRERARRFNEKNVNRSR